MKRFDAIDSLRGVAALMVVVFHINPTWPGYLMVDFFFLLSGFILTHSYLYKEKKTSPVEFISHRLARLYPLHIFALAVYALVYFWSKGELIQYQDGRLYTLLQQLTLTHNVGLHSDGVPWNGPSWSISVEFWINVVFIFYINEKVRNSTLFFLSMGLLLLLYNNVGHLTIINENMLSIINGGLARGFCSFFLGILAYRLYLAYSSDERLSKYATPLECISIFLVFVIMYFRGSVFSNMDMFAPAAFFLVVFVFALDRGLVSKFLGAFKYLGVISYSIYLNQTSVIYFVIHFRDKYDFSYTLFFWLTLITLLIYSHFTYRYIEKPMRKRLRNFLPKLLPEKSDSSPKG